MTEQEFKNILGRGKDLRGQKSGMLMPLYPLKERKNQGIVWHCQCDCGNEYDGIQHFEARGTGWNTTENLRKTQKRDQIKNEWCKNNGIPLIRIPYTHLKNISLNDLLLDTSNFLVS